MQHNKEMNSEEFQGRKGGYNHQLILEGNAKYGRHGLAIGMHDIGECEDAYMIQISLPGFRHLDSNLKVSVKKSGKVVVEGLRVDSKIFNEAAALESIVQELPEEGSITLKYFLPGAVDPRLVQTNFEDNGILSLVIMKDMAKRRADQKSAA